MHSSWLSRVDGFFIRGDGWVDVRVDQMQQGAEEPLLAAVRCRRHHQRSRGVHRQQFAELVVRRGGWRQPVGLVQYNDIPGSPVRVDRGLDSGIHCSQVHAHDPQVVVGFQGVLADRLRSDRPQAATEEPVEVSLPFRHEVSRGDNKSAADKAESLHFPEVHPGHDRLAGSGFICEQEPQVGLRQHRAIDSVHLMRVGLQGRRCESS